VLDNITLTWLTNTGVSSGRLYWENELGFFDVKGVKVPTALTIFPHELYRAPRSWAEAAYPELIYFNEVDKGNHFAAWQEPELFATEVRAAFRTLRWGAIDLLTHRHIDRSRSCAVTSFPAGPSPTTSCSTTKASRESSARSRETIP
jgi:hypothetical protein